MAWLSYCQFKSYLSNLQFSFVCDGWRLAILSKGPILSVFDAKLPDVPAFFDAKLPNEVWWCYSGYSRRNMWYLKCQFCQFLMQNCPTKCEWQLRSQILRIWILMRRQMFFHWMFARMPSWNKWAMMSGHSWAISFAASRWPFCGNLLRFLVISCTTGAILRQFPSISRDFVHLSSHCED